MPPRHCPRGSCPAGVPFAARVHISTLSDLPTAPGLWGSFPSSPASPPPGCRLGVSSDSVFHSPPAWTPLPDLSPRPSCTRFPSTREGTRQACLLSKTCQDHKRGQRHAGIAGRADGAGRGGAGLGSESTASTFGPQPPRGPAVGRRGGLHRSHSCWEVCVQQPRDRAGGVQSKQ